jgi:Rps23 Pro-64 3,4-dihydroxylase Tpa1-like proline 4-hydroxylase
MQRYRQYFNVLGESFNQTLYRIALSKREYFTRSKTSPSKNYPDWRRSTVIYDNQLVDVAATLEQAIRLHLPEVEAALAVPPFEISSFEIQLTSHNDGEYYKWHTDNGTRDTAARVITFVYYFCGQPKKFSGGELVIYQPDRAPAVIDPQNDSIVFFRSHTRHEVKAVTCPSEQFEDGRFTLNGWIRRKETVLRDNYFDARIFGPFPQIGNPTPSRQVAVRRTATRHTGNPARPAAVTPDTAAPTGDLLSSKEPAASVALLNLYSELHRQSRRAGVVDVVRNISRDDFYENYYCLNRPVVLKHMADSSPALQKWTPQFFAEEYGSIPIQITSDRERVSDYEANFQRTMRTVTIADFVSRLSEQSETNDFYLVARNYFFENPGLAELRDDLVPPPEIINVADRGLGTAKLWFGPKGTVTPLHHDEHSILFFQIYGRKQFKLIPSFDLPKVYLRKNFYSAVDLENVEAERYPKFLEASIADVTVEPGDILFLPVGCWHWAKSLDVSISATFCSFHVENGNTTIKRAHSARP